MEKCAKSIEMKWMNVANERSESQDTQYDMKMEIELSLRLQMEHDFFPAPLSFFR